MILIDHCYNLLYHKKLNLLVYYFSSRPPCFNGDSSFHENCNRQEQLVSISSGIMEEPLLHKMCLYLFSYSSRLCQLCPLLCHSYINLSVFSDNKEISMLKIANSVVFRPLIAKSINSIA